MKTKKTKPTKRKALKYEDYEKVAEPVVKKLLEQFQRIRIMFPDYPGGDHTWNGIYTDITMPEVYKNSMRNLAMRCFIEGFKAKYPITRSRGKNTRIKKK